jgi:hypothetical protein
MRIRALICVLSASAAAGVGAQAATAVIYEQESFDFDAGESGIADAAQFDLKLPTIAVFVTLRGPAIVEAAEADLADLKAPPERAPQESAPVALHRGYWVRTDEGAWAAFVVKSINKRQPDEGASSVVIEYRLTQGATAPEQAEPPPAEPTPKQPDGEGEPGGTDKPKDQGQAEGTGASSQPKAVEGEAEGGVAEDDGKGDRWIAEGSPVRDGKLCTGTRADAPIGVGTSFPTTTTKIGLYLAFGTPGAETTFAVNWYRADQCLLRNLLAVEGEQEAVVYIYPARTDRFAPGQYRVEVLVERKLVARFRFRVTAPPEGSEP